MSMEETLAGIAASDLPLQGKLDAFKTEFETRLAPPAVLAIMHRVTDELIASGQAQRALKAGDRAPDFDLPDSEGKTVSSRDLLAKGPIVSDLKGSRYRSLPSPSIARVAARRAERPSWRPRFMTTVRPVLFARRERHRRLVAHQPPARSFSNRCGSRRLS
jgi:hypothetical protein